jgi:leucyl-tRNA synthetase
MADKYIPQEIEPKWQQQWAESGLYATREDSTRPKFYFLTMLPYTSGDVHIGHWYAMVPSDAAARYRRMKGYNVFFPIGFDAFGLPAEGAAIKHGIHPYTWTMTNIEQMRGQLRSMGAMWAWDREAISCDPRYYAWTEWFFLKLYEHGLAYRKLSPVDFCPTCNTTLAREQVWGDDRHCERCSTPVIRKLLKQWFFRITDYAEELRRFDGIEWPERIRTAQINWIGERSEGAEVVFPVDIGYSGSGIGYSVSGTGEQPADAAIPNTQYPISNTDSITVFTTRPDTLWGATFMVLAPEHPLVDLITPASHREVVAAYQFQASRQSDIERTAAEREKTGVFTGAYAINPVNGEQIPIWIADYVLMSYGTGAIMAVPAHDERDFQFALKFGLPIIPVIDRPDGITKSFVFPGSVRDGFADELRAAGMEFYAQPVSDPSAVLRAGPSAVLRAGPSAVLRAGPSAVLRAGLGEGLFVTLRREQVDGYVALMRKYLQPGNWNETVGSRWLFIFEDGIKELASVEADREILARCKAIYPPVSANRTTMEMLHSLPFYRDVLFHADYGTMINSGAFSGTPGAAAKQNVTAWLAEQGIGQSAISYKMHDWLISRQRYWGAPIPMIYCEHCGIVPVPYEDLPVILPADAVVPASGENALKFHEGFLHVKCPRCGADARRETDTMDTFMCSSWYNYAYVSPYWKAGEKLSPDDTPWDPEKGTYWLPVDQYTGGPEHATMHLLYTRFFTKALADMGIVPFREPMLRLFNQGIILGPDGQRMSKSKGNVVSPDEWVEKYGADTVRAYLMFIGPWDAGGPWSFQGIEGVRRFLERVWNVVVEERSQKSEVRSQKPEESEQEVDLDSQVRALRHVTHKTLQKASEDIEQFKFNTLLAALMEFNNYLVKAKETAVYGTAAWDEAVDSLLLMLAPETPHIAEELWQRRHAAPLSPQSGGEGHSPQSWGAGGAKFRAADSIHVLPWPTYDPELARAETITLVVQVNGKLRDKVEVPADIGEDAARELALARPAIQKWLEGKTVRKVIFAGGKLVNVVVS